jgi:hypothetical protein
MPKEEESSTPNVKIGSIKVVLPSEKKESTSKKKSAFGGVAKKVGLTAKRFRPSSRRFRRGIAPPTKKTTTRAKGIATILGAPTSRKELQSYQSKRGRGRPKGTYKYGRLSAEQYKRLQIQRRRALELTNQQQIQQLISRGYSPEQARQVLIQKESLVQRPEADRFNELVEQQSVSPNTLVMIERLKQVQNKAIVDDFEQQRRNKEKRLLADAGNLLRARNLFGPDSAKFNILETEGNILQAPNAFKELPENKILRPRGMNILNTKEAGNDLKF